MTCKVKLRQLIFLMAFGFFNMAGVSTSLSEEPRIHWKSIEEEGISLLRQYIQTDTANPPGNEIRAARFFKSILDREGIEARVLESAQGRGNVYARLKGDETEKSIVLLNHMDVVPADPRHWKEHPFGGVIKDGYIWGRGALDMKGSAILELMTMLILKRKGIPLRRDVIFLGTADEEAGGALGAGFIVKEHFDLLKDAELVLNEGGRIRMRADGRVHYYSVGVAEKSPLWLKLTVSGTPGHGSTPRANSAVNKLITVLGRVMNYRTPIKVVPEVQKFYADIAPLESPLKRERLRNLKAALQDPIFAAEFTKSPKDNATVRNTISVTMLQGSGKINVIPSEASARVDVRLLPGENPAGFLKDLQKVIGDESVKIDTVLSFPPVSSPGHPEALRAISTVARNHHPDAVVAMPLLRGFTDCHYFRERGIPCYGFIPIKATGREGSRIHGIDERISVEGFRFGLRMLYEVVHHLVAK